MASFINLDPLHWGLPVHRVNFSLNFCFDSKNATISATVSHCHNRVEYDIPYLSPPCLQYDGLYQSLPSLPDFLDQQLEV